ncbi:MAG TPA: hypothetical protein VEH04_18725 [Verrucomicrobiae bacterium]|nr:hypothetical protein [Verrucomicrobiae bacterium]
MSSHSKSAKQTPFDLSRWRNVPALLMFGGGAVTLIGALVSFLVLKDGGKNFAFSWLVAYMFCLSICLGALFLVLVHHLFDAGWSVPIRRFNEHIASMLFPWMAILWIPIALFSKHLYAWMTKNPEMDHALHAKEPLFTIPGFYIVSAVCFLIWWVLTRGLRSWSLKQDDVGGAIPTHKMRGYSYWGIFAFAVTLTLAAVMWMKGMQHEWFSTMYGVVYFAGSVWMTLGLVYIITALLDRQGILTDVLHEHQYYFIGSLMFAFTVFYAYIHFAQYFIIWNGNIPEETFWYLIREKGTWFFVGMIIIFGHFFMPFLALLRIDLKNVFPYIAAIAGWNWLMHYFDMAFQIKPVLYTEGYPLRWLWLDIGILAFMVGLLAKVFIAKFASAAPFPTKDPRLIEAMGHYHPVPTQISGGELDECDDGPQPGHAK